MSASSVYSLIREELTQNVSPDLPEASRERIALLVMGILAAKSASPARIARELRTLGLVEATIESCERRVRRIENDEHITAGLCLHPLARHHLALGKPKRLLLVLDPTTQEDRLVMVSVAVWYRGRALPLGWCVWPGNKMLEGERFWERIAALLESVASVLPVRVPIVLLADRAFGTPTFLDMLTERGWSFVVRCQDQTRYRDRTQTQQTVRSLVDRKGQRVKGAGELFKKLGWRHYSFVVLWGRKHKSPLCLVSNLPTGWYLIDLYRRRYPIEAMFRDYKSSGWHWEQGQVTDMDHVERLLVGMALATWMALFAGTIAARQILSEPATGRRRTRTFVGKHSLFTLGLDYIHVLIHYGPGARFCCLLLDWDAPCWSQQNLAHHLRAFIFGRHQTSQDSKTKTQPAPVRP